MPPHICQHRAQIVAAATRGSFFFFRLSLEHWFLMTAGIGSLEDVFVLVFWPLELRAQSVLMRSDVCLSGVAAVTPPA